MIKLLPIGLLLVSAAAQALSPTGKGPCSSGDQCVSGVCVEINSDSYCSQSCGACTAGMFCDAKLFATMGLKVCLKGQASAPPKIQTPPRLPCRSDAQCRERWFALNSWAGVIAPCPVPATRNANLPR